MREQLAREAIDIALGDIRLRHLAAVSAGAAVNLLLDLLRHLAKTSLGKIVDLHVAPKHLVLLRLLFTEAFDLNEVRYDSLQPNS